MKEKCMGVRARTPFFGAKVHGVQARTPVSFEYINDSFGFCLVYFGHNKFTSQS